MINELIAIFKDLGIYAVIAFVFVAWMFYVGFKGNGKNDSN